VNFFGLLRCEYGSTYFFDNVMHNDATSSNTLRSDFRLIHAL
jgi:hypothetical protein